MQIQRIKLDASRYSWVVLDNNQLPIQPILSFIRYLTNVEKSPHTIRNYANHLKLFWEFLNEHKYQWQSIQIDQLSQFIYWSLLQNSASYNV